MAFIQNTGPGVKDAGAQLYLDTLKGYQDREAAYTGNYGNTIAGYERLYNTQGQYGESERLRLNQDFARQLASSQASMVNRGLGNTTILDSAARGINYDRANASLTLNDQLLQRQNQIAQQELNHMGQYNQGLAGLQGERLGWMGGVQQNTQNQNFQGMMQDEAYRNQAAQQAQQFDYSQRAAAQGFNYQRNLAQDAFNNQVNYQNMFGYYKHGGPVPPPAGTDVVPARLTPGEFVLSNDMIAALERGTLDRTKLLAMIHEGRAENAMPMQGYSRGGAVPNLDQRMAHMLESAARKKQMHEGMRPMGAGRFTLPEDEPVGGGRYVRWSHGG